MTSTIHATMAPHTLTAKKHTHIHKTRRNDGPAKGLNVKKEYTLGSISNEFIY